MRQWPLKILLVLGGIFLGLVLIEIGLGLLGIEYPQFYEFDPTIGARLRPGIKGYWLREGGGYVSINSDGWRDREHVIKKPPNTLRIAVLGDSFVEALQVNQEEAFWAIMEKALQSCDHLKGRNIEVLSFGQSGFGTTQELLTLENRIWKFSPDIILLAFTSGNDVSDNSPALNKRETYPFLVLRDGKLVLDDSRLKRLEQLSLPQPYNGKKFFVYRIMDRITGQIAEWRNDYFDSCRTLQLVEYIQEIYRNWRLSKNPKERPEAGAQGLAGAGMFTDIYREPINDDWREAWKITGAVLLKMRDEVVQKGAQFFVVVLSNDIQVDLVKWKVLASRPEVKDVFYPDHRVGKFCQNHGIPVLLLGPSFQEYAIQHQVYLHGFRTLLKNNMGEGHWNRDGHRLAGETIAKWLCPQISLPELVNSPDNRP